MQLKDISPEAAQQIAALLDEALDLPADRRDAWQADLQRREPELHELVRDLLVAVGGSRHALPIETVEFMERHFREAGRPLPSLEGRMFGPYRVVRLLGQGGMGSVWLAERSDGLFARQVALKLVHASLANRTLGARFARERNILAALDHPNIARLLDAGVTDDGQPYLAIEYVDGMPLTTYCDSKRLTVRERIGLIMQVLTALRHAHQNLTVHRDLKPSNILVTEQGQARLLDFGIAKLMTEGEAQASDLTEIGGRALTPEYASPEQIAGQPVNTSSDLYSVGVLLYGLLSGHRPYDLTRDSRGALEEAVLSAEPARPSQRELTREIADARATTPGKLAQTLAGDLDTITLRALKKNPAERYATADAFHQDLQRHLAGQPVLARPDSPAYRLRKFIARHKGAVAFAVFTGFVLLVTTGISIRQALVAGEQSRLARIEAQRAQAVQEFLLDVFKANSVLQPDPLRAQQTTARELLDVGAQRISEGLKDAPEAQTQVLDTLADMYYQLGLFDDAARMRQQRIDVLRRVHGAADIRVADALMGYARDTSGSSQPARAQDALAEAQRILDGSGAGPSDLHGILFLEMANLQQYTSLTNMRHNAEQARRHFDAHPSEWGLFHSLQASARACYFAGDFDCAQSWHREALAEAQRRQPGESAWLITPLVQLAEAQMGSLNLGEAEEHYREALALSRRLHGDLSGITLQTQAKVAGFLHTHGRRAEGTQLFEDVLQKIGMEEANATPDAVGTVNWAYGTALISEGRLAEGERYVAAEVADLRAHYPDTLPLARTLDRQAVAFTAMGRYAASARNLDEALRIWLRVGGNGAERSAGNRFVFGQVALALAQGDATDAIDKLKQVAPRKDADRLPLNVDVVLTQLASSQASLLQDRAADAQKSAREALHAIQRSSLRSNYSTLEADAALRLGHALHRAGDLRSARRQLEHALDLRGRSDAPASPWLAEMRIALADCLLDLNERESAKWLIEQAAAAHAHHVELGEHFRQPLKRVAARALRAQAAQR